MGANAAEFLTDLQKSTCDGGLVDPSANNSSISRHHPQNPATIDNSNAKDQSCQIQVSFTGNYNNLPTGPTVAKMRDWQKTFWHRDLVLIF